MYYASIYTNSAPASTSNYELDSGIEFKSSDPFDANQDHSSSAKLFAYHPEHEFIDSITDSVELSNQVHFEVLDGNLSMPAITTDPASSDKFEAISCHSSPLTNQENTPNPYLSSQPIIAQVSSLDPPPVTTENCVQT